MPASIPHMLLFGSPGAGKSSLLGALAQAAAMQTPALKGQLVDKSGALQQLQKNTYEKKPPPTDGLEAYDVHLEPADGDASSAEATLLDCSGQEAQEILQTQEAFANDHPLREPILDADAVLLLVDVSLPNKQRNEVFDQFGQWLMQLHEARGRRVDVGELPVYLVLTKCDLLARKDDTFSSWLQRIEEGKRKIDERFRAFLKEQGTGFGSLDLRFCATAIKRPAFTDRSAKAQEPFGVAELFRDSLAAAGDFFERRQTSQRRLQNVVFGLIGLVAVLGLLVAFLANFEPDTHSASLEEKAYSVLPKKDATPPARLHGTLKRLEEKRQVLSDVKKDLAFARLPAELQTAITSYEEDIDVYLKLSENMKTSAKFPFMAKTEEEFVAQEKNLSSFTYRPEWEETTLGKRVTQCRQEYERVRAELKKEEGWLQTQIEGSNKLLDEGAELQLKLRKLHKQMKLNWKDDVLSKEGKRLQEEAESWEHNCRGQMQPKPRVLRSDSMPGVSAVTYEYLDKFAAIKDARKRWEAVKVQVKRVSENIQDELKTGW